MFDLDGTLIDSAPDIQAVASEILGRFGKQGLSLEETRQLSAKAAPSCQPHDGRARNCGDTGQSRGSVWRLSRTVRTLGRKGGVLSRVQATLAALKNGGPPAGTVHQQAGTAGPGSHPAHGHGTDFRWWWWLAA